MAPSADLGRHHRQRGRALRHPRRLRPRHRHAVSVRQGQRRARPDDGVDRAVLGRQRDLAGDGRRGPAGGVPAGLCHRHAGALSAGDRDAAGAGVSRRCLRVSRDRRQQGAVEHGLRRRLDARGPVPGRDPRRHDPGHRGEGWRLRRRDVRLGDAVRAAVRARRRVRLCAARRDLAHHEDQGAAGRACAHAGHVASVRGAGLHGGGQSLDAACVSTDQGALVLAAEFFLSLAGAAADRAHRIRRLAFVAQGWRHRSLRRNDRSFPAGLPRPRDLVVSVSGAAVADDLADRRGTVEPDASCWPARWCCCR